MNNDLWSLRERYYARLRQEAELIALCHKDRALSDGRFALAYRKITVRLPLLAQAEVYGSTAAVKRYKAEIEVAKKEMAEILNKLGLKFEDLRPKYRCEKCEDTGADKKTGNICDCFPISLF